MHHAQRSIRVVRPGSRTAATAAGLKPAQGAPGKWSRPTIHSDAPAEPQLPSSSKWSAPQQGFQPGSHTSSSAESRLPSSSKWNSNSPNGNTSQTGYQGLRSRNQPSPPSASNQQSRLRRDGFQNARNDTRSSSAPPYSSFGDNILGSGQKSRRDHPHQGNATSRPHPPGQNTSYRGRADIQRSPPHLSRQTRDHGFDFLLPKKPTNVSALMDRANKLPVSKPYEDVDREVASGEQVRVGERIDRDIKERLTSKKSLPTLEADIDLAPEEILGEAEKVPARAQKRAYKERGSLVSRVADLDAEIPGGSRKKEPTPAVKKKPVKARNRHLKAANVQVYIPTIISVSNLARLLKVRLGTLQRVMTQVGMGTDTSHDHMLSSEYSSLLALEFGRDPVVDDEAAFDIHPPPVAKDKSALPSRPPVVTIMGHVDHGKTTLLDTLRSASVAKGEAGGITQHIGAFSVPVKGEVGRSITFLDTPGHAAFSAMRARGAGVTDIVVLVVAADDGVMPQTREVIDLVKKDGDNVSLVVAINKVDKPGADAEKVEQALLAEGVQLETFGGDVPCVHVSGLTGRGLDRLVETISLVAEMQDLRAEKQGPVHGYVLESKVQKGLGPVATVLLLRGSLTPGSHLICGHTQAKVRLLTSPSGQQIKLVQPGEAVVVSGWKELPGAGDEVLSGTEAEVKKALVNRIRKAEIEATLQDVDAINITRREERERREEELQAKRDRRGQPQRVEAEKSDVDEIKELRVLVKGDVSGSVEAVAGAIQGIGNHLAKVKIIATGVGEVTESDVMRAKAAEGMIIAFSVKAPKAIESLAAGQEVPILSSSVIYRLMDSVKNEVIKLLPVTIERRVRGEASVLEIFDIHLKAKKIMKVAGCRVTNGVIEKNKNARVVRNGETVFEGRLDTFRHLKKDITEAGKGLECGMSLVDFSDLQPGDMIQMYEEIEIPGSL